MRDNKTTLQQLKMVILQSRVVKEINIYNVVGILRLPAQLVQLKTFESVLLGWNPIQHGLSERTSFNLAPELDNPQMELWMINVLPPNSPNSGPTMK